MLLYWQLESPPPVLEITQAQLQHQLSCEQAARHDLEMHTRGLENQKDALKSQVESLKEQLEKGQSVSQYCTLTVRTYNYIILIIRSIYIDCFLPCVLYVILYLHVIFTPALLLPLYPLLVALCVAVHTDYEKEKLESASLKNTWDLANQHFIVAQDQLKNEVYHLQQKLARVSNLSPEPKPQQQQEEGQGGKGVVTEWKSKTLPRQTLLSTPSSDATSPVITRSGGVAYNIISVHNEKMSRVVQISVAL